MTGWLPDVAGHRRPPAGRTGKIRNSTPMKTPIEYTIVAVPFHADAATHDDLARKVNEKLDAGYELLGAPFLTAAMMYQAMTKRAHQSSPPPIP
jgi:hypothetical protein